MPQRMKAEKRQEQLLALMADIHRQAETQGDFTAEAVAKAAGISAVLLYRYVGAEFQALRAQLPGIHRVRDEVMSVNFARKTRNYASNCRKRGRNCALLPSANWMKRFV